MYIHIYIYNTYTVYVHTHTHITTIILLLAIWSLRRFILVVTSDASERRAENPAAQEPQPVMADAV